MYSEPTAYSKRVKSDSPLPFVVKKTVQTDIRSLRGTSLSKNSSLTFFFLQTRAGLDLTSFFFWVHHRYSINFEHIMKIKSEHKCASWIIFIVRKCCVRHISMFCRNSIRLIKFLYEPGSCQSSILLYIWIHVWFANILMVCVVCMWGGDSSEQRWPWVGCVFTAHLHIL